MGRSCGHLDILFRLLLPLQVSLLREQSTCRNFPNPTLLMLFPAASQHAAAAKSAASPSTAQAGRAQRPSDTDERSTIPIIRRNSPNMGVRRRSITRVQRILSREGMVGRQKDIMETRVDGMLRCSRPVIPTGVGRMYLRRRAGRRLISGS